MRFAQEAAINVFSNIRPYLDDQAMRSVVLPKAKALFSKATQVRVSNIFFFLPTSTDARLLQINQAIL
jgi:hypothetical protein